MTRPLLAWFMLLNYLLVVGAGLRVGRPEAPAFSASHPYVHSKSCQQQHYLRLDCFENCNGDQHEIGMKVPTGTGLHFLAQLKGLDVHCAEMLGLVSPAPALAYRALRERVPETIAAVAPGYGLTNYPPPKRG